MYKFPPFKMHWFLNIYNKRKLQQKKTPYFFQHHPIFNKIYFKFASLFARMVELVDTLVSGTSARKGVQVRVLFRVQKKF